MICECKAAIADSAKFCPKCGKKIAELTELTELTERLGGTTKCPQCGAENPATAKFCKKDGAPLSAAFSNRPTGPALPTPRTRRSISLALVGGAVALLIAAAGVGFFYWGSGDQSPVAQSINAGSGEKGLIDTKLAESNQSQANPAPQAIPEPRLEPEPQPGLTARPDSTNSPLPPLAESPAASEPQASLQAPPALGSPQPIKELRPQSKPQPASEAPSELAGLPPQPVSESGAASKPQQALEAPAKLANPAPQLSEPPQPIAEPLPAQPTSEAPLPPLESVPQASPPPASVPAGPKAPAAAKKPAAPKTATMQNELNSGLRQRGFSEVRAKVIDKQTVALSGTVNSAEDKASAGEFVSSASGMKNIRNEVRVAAAGPESFDPPKPGAAPKREGPTIEQVAVAKPDAAPDPAKMEGELNRALREEGVGGVTAQINSDLSATLRGAARSPGEKEKAFHIARQFPALREVKDQIFVVEE